MRMKVIRSYRINILEIFIYMFFELKKQNEEKRKLYTICI